MIPTKETLSVEFKSDQRTLGESIIVDEVVALSNSEGGDLYIGVEDDGEVTGAQPAHRDPIQVASQDREASWQRAMGGFCAEG